MSGRELGVWLTTWFAALFALLFSRPIPIKPSDRNELCRPPFQALQSPAGQKKNGNIAEMLRKKLEREGGRERQTETRGARGGEVGCDGAESSSHGVE